MTCISSNVLIYNIKSILDWLGDRWNEGGRADRDKERTTVKIANSKTAE